ncbi:purine nucleoside phosphorylase-like [Zophobas morio]|uniref:purine nucleoside phosphorylase-like n=1 Tax=Zophobas morio TaxID=2755281 RepID=UPI003082C11E
MQGRFHFYEGHSMANATIGIRVMKALGVKTVIITNASGGLNPNFKGGDIMIINDHINFPGLAGFNPLRGPNDERFGVRFPSVSDLYDPLLHVLVREVAKEEGVEGIQEGTYCFVSGPSYETPAECHLLRKLGGDAVGMSTVPECIVAHHCGIKVIGLSLVTNMVTFEKHSDSHVSHEEVLATGVARAEAMKTLVSGLIGKL